MNSEILSRDDLIQLTKYSQAKKQCAWLAKAGIWFEPDKDGRPSTTWHHVNNPIALRLSNQRRPELDTPNFDAM